MTYTNEQIEAMAVWAEHLADPVRFADPAPAMGWPGDTVAKMFRDYIAERNRKMVVTDEIVEVGAKAVWDTMKRGVPWEKCSPMIAGNIKMKVRAALKAALKEMQK